MHINYLCCSSGSSGLMTTVLVLGLLSLCSSCAGSGFWSGSTPVYPSVFLSLPLAHGLLLLFIPGNLFSSGVWSSGYIINIVDAGMVEVSKRGWRRGRRRPAAQLRTLMFSSLWAIDAWHGIRVFILWHSCCLCVMTCFGYEHCIYLL